MNLFKRLKKVEEGTKIEAKIHHFTNTNLNEKDFYKIPEYKGTFQFIELIDEGYCSYNTGIFNRKNDPQVTKIMKIKYIKEKYIKGKRN